MHKQRTDVRRSLETYNTEVPMTGKVRREPGESTLLWLWRVLLALLILDSLKKEFPSKNTGKFTQERKKSFFDSP